MKKKSETSWISNLLKFAAECKGRLLLSVLLSIAGILCGIVPYLCVYGLVKAFAEGSASGSIIAWYCGWAAGGMILKTGLYGISTSLSHISAYTILESLRNRVTEKFLKVPLGEVTGKPIGEIVNLIVERIESIEPPLAHMIPEVCGNFVLPLVSIIILWVIDWRMALASLVTIPLSMLPFIQLSISSGKNYPKYMEASTKASSAIVEYVEGIQVIKAFGRAGTSYEKFSDAILNYRKFVLKWMSSTWASMKLCFALFPSTLLGTLPVGLLLCAQGVLSAPEMLLCILVSMSMIGSLAKLEIFGNEVKQMGYVVQQTQEYLDMKELSEPQGEAVLHGCGIELKNVRFSYTEEGGDVLHGINLSLPQGSYTALVGPSGSGKSTVAKLIARFWDVTDGSIAIGGTDLKKMPLKQLSNMVSFVTQDNYLFRCSIRENIRAGNPSATDEQVEAAAKAAQCDEFIRRLEQGYDTPAGEAGKRLSGGERQRIAIARMILKDAPIVILDEATAFTDPENEDKIQKSIEALTRGKTLLVIAHRLSTVRDADCIVLMNEGKIEAKGTHDELLRTSERYQRMWKAHLSARDWAAASMRTEVNGHV